MQRIAVLQLGYETNTFSTGKAQLQDLGTDVFMPAEKVLGAFRGNRSSVSGGLAAIEDLGATPVPMDLVTRGGAFNAGPIMSENCVLEAMDHICAQLKARYDEYDGVFYAMHGAGCAEDFDDADGYFLERIREVIGDKPLMASLDLHANMTQKMVAGSDGFFGIKCVPHTDYFEAGYLAASTLIRAMRGEVKPQMVLRRLPMLIPSTAGCTLEGAAKKAKEYFAEYVEKHGLIDATFFHGFSATDSPTSSASVLVVADGYAPEKEADELAQFLWDMREDFNNPPYGAKEAVDVALSLVREGYVVINEGSDNPGGGSPGDGTHLLREFLRRDLKRSIMGPLYDPEAVAICYQHKVGDKFSLTFGGKTMPVFGDPLALPEVELLNLCDGSFQCVSPMYMGAAMCHGPSARLRCGNVEFILVSVRFQTYDDRPFLMTGARMEDYDIVGLKSMNHFRAYFRPIADALVATDTPSNYPSDLKELTFQNVIRPIYPLDENVTYQGNWPEES